MYYLQTENMITHMRSHRKYQMNLNFTCELCDEIEFMIRKHFLIFAQNVYHQRAPLTK